MQLLERSGLMAKNIPVVSGYGLQIPTNRSQRSCPGQKASRGRWLKAGRTRGAGGRTADTPGRSGGPARSRGAALGPAAAPRAPAARCPPARPALSLFSKPPEGLTFLSGQTKSFFMSRHIKKDKVD